MNPLRPEARLLIKLGSAIIHAQEYMSVNGHPYDKTAFDVLITDHEVRDWIMDMGRLALLPVPRSPV